MKKFIFLTVASCITAVICSSCACWNPIDRNDCSPDSHDINSDVFPNVLDPKQAGLLPTQDYFRPEFKCGDRRVSAKANASERNDAMRNAICKFLLAYECDQIISAKIISTKIVHPRWFFFHYTTYSSEVTGFPVTMTGLKKGILSKEEAEKRELEKPVRIYPWQLKKGSSSMLSSILPAAKAAAEVGAKAVKSVK